MDFDCIMLAAGISSRMGKWKMTLPLEDSTIIETSVANALGGCGRIILVTGFHHEELETLFQNHTAVTCVYNPDFEKDMFSSVREGSKHIESDYFYVALGDMPFIPSRVYRELAPFAGEKAVFPELDGRQGHPVLLPASILPRIRESVGLRHMRDLLADYPSTSIPFDCEGVIHDIDTREDYLR